MIYRFGSYSVDTNRLEFREDGALVTVEPQVFALLAYLIGNCDRVVTKDEIIDAVWGGRIVSDSTLNSRVNAVRKVVGDDGKSQSIIKTIPRRGFRFIAEVKDDKELEPSISDNIMQRPAVVVLPFENLSGDPELEYFVDGLTEDIITALSLWRSFPVIARNSAFVYKGEVVNVQELSRLLDVRYVLEGSVRKAGKQIRVAAQLVDADTGHNILVEKFDRFIEDVFELQDDLTQKIAAIVAPTLERVGHNRSTLTRPQSFDVWSLVQRGMALLDEYTKESNLRARQMFKNALELDPSYSRVYSGLALAYARALMSGYEFSRVSTANKALKAARQAVALDSSDAFAHMMLGMSCLWARQNKNALASYQRAVELNPSYAHARGSLGDMLDRLGKTDEGISLMEEALELNPDASNLRHFNTFLARACITARRYEEATEWARTAIHLRSDLAHAHCLMAIGLAHLDRSEEAKAALDECKRVQPDFFESAAELSPYENPATNDHIRDGLRKAGLQKSNDC